MTPDKRDELYNNLINSGRVTENEIGTIDDFKAAIDNETHARLFYNNLRKSGIFSVDEIGEENDFVGSIADDFAQPTAATQPTAQQPTQRNMGTPGVVPNRFGLPTQQQGGTGPVADAAPNPQVPAQPLSFQERVQKSVGMAHNVGKAKADFSQRMSAIEQGNKPFSSGKAQQYDPTTGETKDVYYTTTGQAVTTPMERDIANVDNSPQGRIGKELEDAYAERDRLEQELSSRSDEVKADGTSIVAKIGAGTLLGLTPAGVLAPELAKQIDKRIDPQWAMLNAAKRANDKRIAILERDRDRDGFFRTVGKTLFDIDTWDFGANEIADAVTLSAAADKKLTGKAGEAQEALMRNTYLKQIAEQRSEDDTFMQRAGDITANAIPFVLEFILTGGGYAAIGAAGRRLGAKAAAKIGAKGFAAWTMKNTGTLAGNMLSGLLMANTTGLGRTAADIMGRHQGVLTQDENGEYVFRDGKSWGRSIYEGEMAQAIEYFTEHLGNSVFDKALGRYVYPTAGKLLTKGLDKLGASKVSEIFSRMSNSQWAAILDKGGIQGYPSEVLEEAASIVLNSLFVGDNQFSDLWDRKTLADILGGMALSIGFMQAPGVARGAYNTAQYYRFKHNTDKSDQAAAKVMGEQWEGMRDLIDNTPNEGMQDVIDHILDSPLPDDFKATSVTYAYNLMKLRGYNLRTAANAKDRMADTDENGEPRAMSEEETAVNEAFANGYEADEQQRSDISIEREDNPNDPQAQAAWQGVEDRIRQDAADRADQRRAEGERMAYKGKGDMQGMLRPLTIKEESSEIDPQTGEKKKKTVYLVNGTIAIEPNGNGLSREGTDKTIYVYDPETGEAHELDPFGGAGVLSVGDAVSMEDYLANNEQQSQAEVQQEIDNATGKVNVQPNTPFVTPEGRQGIVKSVEGDNVIVQFADGEMEEASIPLADLQQYADALRRQEYEARHPQQTPAEQQQQPNTATEGQTPTAEQTAPQGSPTVSPTQTAQQIGAAAQPQVEYPRDKQGNIDYDKIGDATTFATALGEEFGEDAPATLDEIIAEETAKMKKQNAVGKARIRKRLAMLEEAKAQLTPTEEAPAEAPTAEVEQPTAQTEEVTIEPTAQSEEENDTEGNKPSKKALSQLEIAKRELADDAGALEILNDLAPRTLDEVAAMLLTSGKNQVKLQMSDEQVGGVVRKGFLSMTGYSREEAKRYLSVFASHAKGGVSFARFGEMVEEAARVQGVQFDENDPMAGVNAALEMFGNVGRMSDINNYIADRRTAQAYDYHHAALAQADAYMREQLGVNQAEYDAWAQHMEQQAAAVNGMSEEEYYNNIILQNDERTAETDNGTLGEEGDGTLQGQQGDEIPTSATDTRGVGEDASGEQAEVSTEQTEGTESTGINLPVSEIEERFELKAPTTNEEFLANIDEILKQYADRKAAFYMVYDYQAGYPQYQQALADKVGATTREDLQKWCAKRQTQLRRGVDKERREKAAEVAVDNIINQALQASAEMDEQLEQQATQETPKQETNEPKEPKRLISDEQMDELKERLRKKLRGQLNSGIDPETLSIGLQLAVGHIERGLTKFADFAKRMIEDLGDAIRPYLKSFYNGARDFPGAEKLAEQMTTYDEVRAFDVENFDKARPSSIVDTAKEIAAEQEIEKQVEKIKKPTKGNKKEDSTLSNTEQGQLDLFGTQTTNNNDNGLERPNAVRTEGGTRGQHADSTESSVRTNGERTPQESGGTDGSGESGSVGALGQELQHGLRPNDELAEKRNTRNNHAERGKDYAPKDVDARIEANIAAIERMQQLRDAEKQATPADMAVLRKFSGWGGLGKAFDNYEYSTKLKALLGEEAYEQANLSRYSAFYTPAKITDTLWDIARALGFKGGKVLEGSAGIGNILGAMPTDMSEQSSIEAVEIDPTTGGILSLLYPDAKVNIKGFEETRVPNGSVDLAITNVPFVADMKVPKDETGDADLSSKFKRSIQDFCIAKNVRKLKEGGIGIFITSSGTLDNSDKLRSWLTTEGNADVVGVYRMHKNTFGGASVTTDIIVIRKRVNKQKSAHAIDVSGTTAVRTAKYTHSEWDDKKKDIVEKTDELTMDYNTYFVEHPEMMGGEMKFAFEKGDTYRPTSRALYPKNGVNQDNGLKEFVQSLSGKEWDKASDETTSDTVEYKELGEGITEGSMFVGEDGAFYVAQQGLAVPLEINNNKVKGHTKQECFEAYTAIKDAVSEVLDYETKNAGDEGLQPLLDKLNKAYDDFVSTYGHFQKNTSISFLKNDIGFSNVRALETMTEYNDEQGNRQQRFKKGDIFSKRVVEKEAEPKPTNTKDGVIASMYKYGRIDIPYISKQIGKSEEEVKNEILESGIGFENPQSREVEVTYEYLSGNVREKLRQAQEANENGEFDRNIKALQDIIPMNIPSHLIEFSIGSSWLDPKLYRDYISERTGMEVNLTYTNGMWVASGVSEWNADTEKNRAMSITSDKVGKTVWGHTMIIAAMQNKTIEMKKVVRDRVTKSQETIADPEATRAIAAKIDEIRADFKDWARAKMQSDPALAEVVEEEYNERFNNFVPKSIPDDFVPEYFGGASRTIKLQPHQAKAAIRATTQPLMIAHEVGAGKTYTLITAAMEMRRIGTARKPMIVVQNATVGQFVESAKALYPNAKILTLEDAEHNKGGRLAFYSMIRYNDWDMIIVPQSTFNMIPDSEDRKIAYIKEKIEEKEAALDRLQEIEGNETVIDEAEKEIEKMAAELEKIMQEKADKKKKRDQKRDAMVKKNATTQAKEALDRYVDDVEDFDQMGIDAILVDEAHNYKRLGFATAMRRGVKGIDPAYSKKAQSVFLKAQSVMERTGGKNVIFATGTPISNTAAEIWTFMRYLMPAETLREYDIYYFDDFVRNFGNLTQMLEFSTDGKFKENNRFAGYINMPELARIWSGVADTKLTDDIERERLERGEESKIPDMEGGKATDIYLPQTRALRSVILYVKQTLKEFDKMKPKEKKENRHIPLVMYGIASRAAVDVRLVLNNGGEVVGHETGGQSVSSGADEPNSKTNEAVRQTLRSLEETKDYKGTVAIFADLYQNKETGFNLYEEIKRKLVAEGVPEEQIAIMKSGMTMKKKLGILDKVNAGEIRVIMGSTATLGTGVNIQERLHTLIHMDAPNRPMDYTQRNGRILRQGNIHKQMGKPVRILRFGVEDSLDVTAYQRLKTKGAIADSVMRSGQLIANSMENRTMEEVEDLFGDAVAQLSGSEYAMLKQQAEREVRKYEAKRKQYESDQTYIHNQKPRLQGQIESAKQRAAEANAALAKVEKADGEKQIVVGKKTFADVSKMADFFKEYNKKVNEDSERVRKSYMQEKAWRDLTMNIGGFDFNVHLEIEKSYETKGGSMTSVAKRTMTYSCEALGLKDVPVRQGLLRNAVEDIMENVLSGNDFRDVIEATERSITRNEEALEQMGKREGKPFEFSKELEEAKQRYEEYEQLMKAEMEAKEEKYAEMDAETTAIDASALSNMDEEDESTDSDVRFRGEEEPVFYSNAMRAVENIKQERATPEQWVKMIEKQGGMKAGEDKWLGLSEWLKGSDAKTLTKGEVLDYIRANEIQVEEVSYSDARMPDDFAYNLRRELEEKASEICYDVTDEYEDEIAGVEDFSDELDEIEDETINEARRRLDEEFGVSTEHYISIQFDTDRRRLVYEPTGSDRDFSNNFAQKVWNQRNENEDEPINETRLRYTTEGLDNKREIVLTVPSIEPWNEHDEIHFGEAGGGRAVAWVRFGETTDADGKRVLVIDEIQSKRHQEGREKGYTKDGAQDAVIKANIKRIEAQSSYDLYVSTLAKKYNCERADIYSYANDAEIAQTEEYRKAVKNAEELYEKAYQENNGVPDAPFEKNWHEVALKRMLRYAAENGYDKVAWTKGEQQAERYGIGGVLDYIRRGDKKDANTIPIEIKATNHQKPIYFDVDLNGNVTYSMWEEFSGKNLSDIVGKEIANKLLNAPDETILEGNGLRYGGEGMKGFYDQILPRFMDKYGKKWGVKTGEVELPNIGDNGLTMWSVDVTDDMRESVMRGQPLFRPKTQSREGGEEAAQGEWYDRNSVERIGEFAGYTPKQIAKMNARQEQSARNKFRDTAEKLHLSDNITFADTIDDVPGLTDKQRREWRRKKGWYSPRTGKIVIILGNHKSMDDVMKSILHEGVAHHGLRQMFGEHFNTFLDNVYRVASPEIRDRINTMAKKHGLDFREATEEYLAMLAEDTDFERPENQSWWKQVKAWFIDMLHKIGFKLHDAYETITDNELRYILWRSYENLVNPGRYNSVVEEAKDIAKQYELKVGQWDETWTIAAEEEPNATIEYGGRRIPIWATNGRRENRADRVERNDRMGSDYNVAADGVAEDAAEYAQRDAEYMEAVNNGDMEKAQRMVNEAAKRAMPNSKLIQDGTFYPMWHFTDKEFTSFLPGTSKDPNGIRGIYFAPSNKGNISSRFGKGKPYFLNVTNPIVPAAKGRDEELADRLIKMQEGVTDRNKIAEINKRFVEETGVDGVIDALNGWCTMLDPSQIKSADPVTYDDNGNVIPLSQRFNEGSDDIRFRDGEDEETGAPKPQARGAYERMVSSAASQWKEAMQDSMLSLKKLYQAVSQAYKGSTKGVYRIEDEKGYENAYLAENRMHSMSEAQIHAYQQDYMKPLQRAIHALTDGKREAYETLTDYMMAKHGLERNEVMAKRDAKKAWEEQNKSEIGNPNYTATKNAVFANIDAGVDDLYLEYRKQDYAGLTALTGIEDVEEAEKEAQRMVDEYEQQHDTTDLWIATNRATRRSLFKMLESGLLSPQRHAEIRDMYQYYIPLQGFDSDVAEDVYAYMGSDGTRLYGTTIRAAKGRKSKADDPIATIAMNGEAAIRRGNRNLMKQHFLRFVQSHPSDLVSINDVWLRKNANGEWEQYFDADLKETDTPEEVARKVRDFNERMEQEAAANPDLYKRSRDLPNVPFRVLNVRDMEQHQVMVQVDGKNYLLTINGNPRAAQALNGLTNPDVFTQGAFGSIMNATQSVVRTLSQFYTTRNPNFVLSNFLRDAVYTNSMVLAKESPNYALNFHKNFLLLPNERMGVLFASWENGKLREKLANGTASNMEKMFYDFMMNGGETGWTSLRDIEKHKRDLQKALKREGNIAASALNKLGDFFDITNRMIENHARFTAYVTSIEMGRSVERAVWDAKEISVNFNKKGAGDKFLKAKNQTFVGKVGAFVSGLGRGNFAFWNASLQGLNNIARIGKRNPAKFMAVATPLLGLGVAIPLLNALLGGDDDDDKNAYWNLPEYVRRSNICFRFTKDMPWITIPLPIEFRAIYGLGELGSGVALGKEHYSDSELTKQVAAQFSQVLPLDFMEGGGGWHCLYPTYIKPVIEAYSNQSWTGLPIYRKNTYGQYDVAPEWQRAYSNTNNQIMAATKWLNEATGGDEVQGGNIDFNPARIEYMLRGYLGGYFTVADQVIKMGETATGNREFEWRNMMLANRVVKEGDERTEARKLTNEYFNLKEEYDKTDKSLKAYKKKQDEGTLSVVGQAHYIALMNDSEEYGRYLVFGTYKPLLDAYYKQIKEANAAGDSEEAKRLERGQNELRREMVNIIHDMDNGGTFDRKKVATGINENLKKMQNDKLWDAQDKAINKSIEADNALNPTDNVEE